MPFPFYMIKGMQLNHKYTQFDFCASTTMLKTLKHWINVHINVMILKFVHEL